MTNVNLLPWRELRREQVKKKFMSLLLISIITAASIVFIVQYYVGMLIDGQMVRNQRLQDEITLFNSQITEIKKLKEIKDGLISRMTIIKGLLERRVLIVHLFDELIKILPDGVYLTELKRTDDKITLLGYSESNSNISVLMRNIQQNPWIQDPDLTEIKKATEVKTAVNNEFNLSFFLKPKTLPMVSHE